MPAIIPAFVALAEFTICGLVINAIGCLRHFREVPPSARDRGVRFRYVVPVLTLACALVFGTMIMLEQQEVAYPEDSNPAFVGMALGLGVALVALVVWLLIEVRRYRARPHIQ